MRYEGKVALLTGAGSGIGRATAQRLASEGARIFGHDVNADALAETASMVGDAMATRVGDVTDPEECRATVAEAVERFGRLDVLGNIAGIARSEHVLDVSVEQYRRMMAVNVDAYFFFAQAAIPHLLEANGNIVNLASNAGLMGQAYTVVYCVTKGAVVQLTRALAMEFIKQPLRVNAIAPGGVLTTLTQTYQIPEDVDFELMAPYTGFRGMSEADEVAGLFAYLASDEAKSITGSIHSIDNGVTAG